jgi:hypothetical protein
LQQVGLQSASMQAGGGGFGSPQASYSLPLPEQQAFGELTSVSGPTQVQIPPLHVPEKHSALAVQGAPFAANSWHRPLKQSFDVQLPSSVQADASGWGASHAAWKHDPDAQSESIVHGWPFAAGPQAASTHWLARHSTGRVHAIPLGCGGSHVPLAPSQ